MSLIEIKKVETKKELKTFIDFHYDLYEGNEYDVPNLFSDDMNTPVSYTHLFVDLTGGFGVDFSYIASRLGVKSMYVERQAHLCEAAKENFGRLGLKRCV